MNKAQGLSLNTMVMAAIALIILLVLVGIFSGYFGDFTPSLFAAGERTCDVGSDGNSIEGFTARPEAEGCEEGKEQRVYGNFKDNLAQGDICCKVSGFKVSTPPPDGVRGDNAKSICTLPDECLSSTECTSLEGRALDGVYDCGSGVCCRDTI